MDQEPKNEKRFIMIPMEVMMDERLTLADKAVYGRGHFFNEYFESAGETAKLLGISENQVKISKRKLESLGFMTCIANDGRGKRYVTLTPWQQGRLSENDRQRVRKCQSDDKNLTPEYKESLNEQKSFSLEDKSSKDGKADGESSKSLNEQEAPKRYGNAEINDLLDLWAQETGFSHHGTKMERYAISGLLRQYGSEATKALIRRVGRATRSRDRFAPQIAKPSQLRGKYEKLTALTVWENRKDLPSDDGPDLRKLYETPAEYREPQQETTLTKEELHQHAEDIRERYKGTAYEHIFARRAK